MKYMLFSEATKTADLIHANYRLFFVLPRFGIPLGFGEKTIGEICAKYGIDPSLFLLVCNVYTFHEYLPDPHEIRSFDAEQLLRYLQNSHLDYKNKLEEIHRKITPRGEVSDSRVARIITRFFDDYQNEVVNHFAYEEGTVFPYISHLYEKERGRENFRIGQFEENHSNIEEKLNDLKNIIIKYLPEEWSSDSLNQVLLSLFLLEDDLNTHALIEDKILVPLVTYLEGENHGR